MSDIESLTKGGIVSLVAVIIVVVPLLVKGLYALTRGWAQSRKEFLDVWDPAKISDSLWLETVVMHGFGNHPPASVIRGILRMREPRRTLRDLSVNWRYLEGDDVGAINWKKSYRNKTLWRRAEIIGFCIAYAVLGFAAVLMLASGDPSVVIPGGIMLVLAILCLLVPFEIAGVSDVLKRVTSLCEESGSTAPAPHPASP